MKQEIMVSVICNVYNHAPYLRDALEGFVSQQTTFPFEVLVHDDASTDQSADIIREYEAKYPEIIKPIYQTENQYSQKVPITRTFQIPRIQGKYVAMCEGDDYWTDPMKLQKQFDFLEAHPDYSLCACSTVWLDMRTGKTVNLCRTEEDRDVTMDELILEKRGRVFQFATIFMRTAPYCQRPDWMGLFRIGDFPLVLHAATCGKIRMMADTMAVYRNQAPGSWTSRFSGSVQYRATMTQHMIDGLTAFNEATGRRYNDAVTRRINLQKYHLARANRDWKAMRSGELREIYRARSLSARLSDFLACKAPGLQQTVRRMLGRI